VSPEPKTSHEQLLESIRIALVAYAQTLLSPGNVHPGNSWIVLTPNFVAFRPQPRKKTLRVSLRGYRGEYDQRPELPLKRGRPGYSECVIEGPHQLLAAAEYIHSASGIYRRRNTPPEAAA